MKKDYKKAAEKCEKERRRRHYKAELEMLQWRTARFVHYTYDFLRAKGISEKEIFECYLNIGGKNGR